jgi:hypothetical protein
VAGAQGEQRLEPTHDVFISHSSQDRAIGEAACAALERAGRTCWIAPRDIMPGEDYGEAIVDGIRASRTFLLIVSAHSVASPQVRRETERAANAGAPIIPFRIEDVLPSKSLEFFISSAHWLDAISRPMEPHYDYLVKVVERLLAESAGTTLPPMPMRLATAPVPAAAPATASRFQPKVLIAVAAIAGGSAVAGVAIWRGTADRQPAAQANQQQPGPHSIFTRRATTLDPRKPVRLRAGQALDAPTIAIIGVTDLFFVAPRNGNWWPAQLANGTQGFVHAQFVRVIDDEAAPGNSQASANLQAPVGEPAGAAPSQPETNRQ